MGAMEFDLSQGWSRGLKIIFGDIEASKQFNLKTAFHVKQVHGNQITRIASTDITRPSPLEESDGMILQGDWFRSCKRPLLIKAADCLPLFYIDRISQSLAAVHAGWRGIQKGIHLKPFESGDFNPKTTWVWCGPSLNHFEVKSDMWKQFPQARLTAPFFTAGVDSETRLFSPWEYLAADFKKIGVDIFYNAEVNTQDDESFWSYRREKQAGRLDAEGKCAGLNYSWMGFG
jgi:copper oxidase (laccase) domain-containing protein